MPSIVDHPIFEANGLTPLDLADLMCHFLSHLFSGRMATEQFLAFITHKLSGPGAVMCTEDEEMVFAEAMAKVYHEKMRKSDSAVGGSSLTPPPDTAPSEPQKLVPAGEHEDAMQEVIMTDDVPPDDQMVPKIEGDMNDRAASCAPATERAFALDAVPPDVAPVDAEARSTIEINPDNPGQEPLEDDTTMFIDGTQFESTATAIGLHAEDWPGSQNEKAPSSGTGLAAIEKLDLASDPIDHRPPGLEDLVDAGTEELDHEPEKGDVVPNRLEIPKPQGIVDISDSDSEDSTAIPKDDIIAEIHGFKSNANAAGGTKMDSLEEIRERAEQTESVSDVLEIYLSAEASANTESAKARIYSVALGVMIEKQYGEYRKERPHSNENQYLQYVHETTNLSGRNTPLKFRQFQDKVKTARRLLEVVKHVGYAPIIFGDWMTKHRSFHKMKLEEWQKFRDALTRNGPWIRYTAEAILGTTGPRIPFCTPIYDMSAWRKGDFIISTGDVSERPTVKSLHRPLWNDMSCLLDALVLCICAMAFHPSRLYCSSAVLGTPASRQIAFEMGSLAQQYKSWLEVPAPSLTERRDAWRNLLLDCPRFVDKAVDLPRTGLDVLDKVVLTQDPFQFSLVGRGVCKDCGSNETTFVKAMGGLYLSIQPDADQYAFRTVQNIVNFVVDNQYGINRTRQGTCNQCGQSIACAECAVNTFPRILQLRLEWWKPPSIAKFGECDVPRYVWVEDTKRYEFVAAILHDPEGPGHWSTLIFYGGTLYTDSMSSWLSPVESVTWDTDDVSLKLTPDILKTSHPVRFYFVQCGDAPSDASRTNPEGKWFRVDDKSGDVQFPTPWPEPTYPPKVDESHIPASKADIVPQKHSSPEIDEAATIEAAIAVPFRREAESMAITISTPGRPQMPRPPSVVPDTPPAQKKRRPASDAEDEDLIFLGELCDLTASSPEPRPPRKALRRGRGTWKSRRGRRMGTNDK